MKTLDLYAKIESMIGFYDEYEELYSSYLKLLSNFKIDKIIDIGCGNGKLLKLLQECKYSAFGIDKSPAMIAIAKKLKVDVSTQELNDFQEESFDCALAVADVLNYMKTDELNVFFKKVSRVLKKDGYFLADINTQEGFELADGVLVRDEKEKFLSVESFFKDNILTTNITLFEQKDELFKKQTGKILQYNHSKKFFKKLNNFKLLSAYPITIFGEKAEKLLMVFQKI